MAKSSSYEVPAAKEAMNRFKQEVASEVGVNLKEGYNGDLTSKQAGTIGGNMVKKMINQAESQMSNKQFAISLNIEKDSKESILTSLFCFVIK